MNPSIGSGAATLGGNPFSQVLQQAQSQGDMGATQAQTPSSAGFDPMSGQALPPQPPQGAMPPTDPSQMPQDPQMAGAAPGSEASMIIDVLGTRLKNDSKLQSDKLKATMPPEPTPAPTPQVPQY